MAHYAYLDESNIVIDVIVGKDETELINGLDPETYYGAVRTSYNGKIRKNYAGIGYLYDPIKDAFIAPKPDCHPELITLDEETCQWLCGGIHEAPPK
jgi:hypothetical protein